MHHQEFEAPEALRSAMKCFWHNRIDFAEAPSSFEVLPDGYVEIIFIFGGPAGILVNGHPQVLSSPFMVGLLGSPVEFYVEEPIDIVGIRCYPWRVFDLLGIPPKKGIYSIHHPIARLQNILSEPVAMGRIEEAMIQVAHYLQETITEILQGELMARVGAVIINGKGMLPVRTIATAAHTTIRTMERSFRQSSGHTVKDVSAVMRFELVRNQLWLEPKSNLSGLAHQFGYTDQSHMTRDFKRYSGTTPAAFARKAGKEKKILSGNFVAFVQD